MASTEYIMKRIEGKKNEITKLEKKLERINKAAASDWENNPYYYSEYDFKWTTRDLEEAKKALAKYEQELEKARDREQSRNVPAITKFLDGWKERVTSFYAKGINDYYTELETVHAMFKTDYDKACKMSKALRERVNGKYEEETEITLMGYKRVHKVKVAAGDLEAFAAYLNERNEAEALAKLEKELTAEYNRKYDFIIERTTDIVKVITDASGLRVGATGELNGYIKGTEGTAKVQTIDAGGWNIQCYHFRTLIHSA